MRWIHQIATLIKIFIPTNAIERERAQRRQRTIAAEVYVAHHTKSSIAVVNLIYNTHPKYGSKLCHWKKNLNLKFITVDLTTEERKNNKKQVTLRMRILPPINTNLHKNKSIKLTFGCQIFWGFHSTSLISDFEYTR